MANLLSLTAGGISPAASHIQLNGEQGEISTPKKYSPRLYAYIIPPLARQSIYKIFKIPLKV